MSTDALYKKYKIDPKKYLKNMVMGNYATIPISPAINQSCGGGIKEGSLVIISGHEKLGKSTLCLQIAANAQKLDDKIKRRIVYFDVENKVLERDLKGIHGLNYEDMEIIGSSELGPLWAEAYFNIAENIVTNDPHSIIIFDSLSMLLTKSEMEYNFDDGRKRPDVPAYTSTFCRKMSQLLRPSKSILLAINHVYVSQGTQVSYLQESGGKKLQYAGNYKFQLTDKKPFEADGRIAGNTVGFKCVYHPAGDGAGPKERLEFTHRFHYGIDEVIDYINLGLLYGIVTKGGAWYCYGDAKKQGIEKMRSHLMENPEVLKAMKKEIEEQL